MSKCFKNPVLGLVLSVLLGIVTPPLRAASLSFVSPVCGSTATGTINLQAKLTGGAPASVVYSMGSYRIGAASGPQFSLPWDSAIAMDGISAIQAVANDAGGNELASAECLIDISNRNAFVTVTSPDLTQSLSGTVAFTVSGSDSEAFPAVWALNIDGEEQSTIWTDNSWQNSLTVTFSIDTTRFTNGSHELQIDMNSISGPVNPQWVNWRGMVNRVINLENGQVWMDTIPQAQNLQLAPGATGSVGCIRLFTDGSSGACGAPLFVSSNPSVASVDANGNVTAEQTGFAQITLTDGSKTAAANVWVTASQQIPHFGGNGTLLTQYTPGLSLFVTSPFFLDAAYLESNASWTQEAVQAGVNSLSFGLYQNPRDVTTSFSSWQSTYNTSIVSKMQWAAQNGFHLLLTGDDIFRNIGTDAWFTLNWQYGSQAVQYAVSQMAQTGVGIGIEAIDEASSVWGPRPVPEGLIGQANYVFTSLGCVSGTCTFNWPNNGFAAGAYFALEGSTFPNLNTPPSALYRVQNPTASGFQFAAPNSLASNSTTSSDPNLEYLWFAGPYCTSSVPCNPVVPNNALQTMRGWMNTSPAVPVAFPSLASDPASVDGNWMGPGSLSDYASNYFTSLKTRTTYPWSEGIQEIISSMEEEFYSRQPHYMLNRPQLMQVSLAGASYTKGNSSSGTYLPGTDSLDQPGVSPEHVSAVAMASAAMGGAGERFYYYEEPTDLNARAADPPGTALQTGSNAENLQTSSWHAMGYAAKLLNGTLQPYILGGAANSPGVPRNMISAVRNTSTGILLMVTNGNDWDRTINTGFGPYPHPFGVARYLVQSTGIATDLLPALATGDSLTLSEGETVVYIIPNAASAMPLNEIVLPPTESASPVIGVQYGYIYAGDLNQRPVNPCVKGSCSIAEDSSIGPLYYRYILANGSFTPVQQANIRTRFRAIRTAGW